MSQIVRVSRSKLQKLEELQCRIFRTTFNPTKMRTGAKILQAPLKGQTLANYYGPSDFPNVSKMVKSLSTPEFQVVNEPEQYRLDRVEDLKRRGKGAPKKIREAPSASAGKGKKKK